MPAAAPARSPTAVAAAAPVSTLASAGRHNGYIWTKANYFFGGGSGSGGNGPSGHPGEAETAELVALGAGTVPPSALPSYIRAGLVAAFIANVSFALVNFIFLPLQLGAWAWVTLQASKGQRVRWPRVLLRVLEGLVGWWQCMVSALLERVLGMRVVLAGDVITEEQRGEGALILSNHPSTADWNYLFSWLPRQGSLTHLKIVLKGGLHGAPILGWALQCARYLFLARNWEKDQKHMERIVQHWAAAASSIGGDESGKPVPVQLLLFPEGTDLRPVSFDQSASFVAKQAAAGVQLPSFEHVLHPRVTGFVHLVKLLRATGGAVTAVYDLTLGSSPVPVTIENLARGAVPSHFHVHARRFELKDLPVEDAALAQWLQQRWVEKERLLEAFYSNPPGDQRAFPRSAAQDALAQRLVRPMQLAHFSALFVFGVLGLLHAFAIYAHPLLLLGAHVLLSGVWVWLSRPPYNGFDHIMLDADQAAEEQPQQQRQPMDNKKTR